MSDKCHLSFRPCAPSRVPYRLLRDNLARSILCSIGSVCSVIERGPKGCHNLKVVGPEGQASLRRFLPSRCRVSGPLHRWGVLWDANLLGSCRYPTYDPCSSGADPYDPPRVRLGQASQASRRFATGSERLARGPIPCGAFGLPKGG
jgi:hypothetical protein